MTCAHRAGIEHVEPAKFMTCRRFPALLSWDCMNYQAVIFDLDDTLLDTFRARIDSLQTVFDDAGIQCPAAERFLRGLDGAELREALTQHEATRGMALNLFESYRRAYWTKRKGLIGLYPGIEAMLQTLHARGLKLAIVTQKGRQFDVDGFPAGAARELDEVGISDLFEVVIGFEDVSRTKPHPEGINILLNRLAISRERTLMVGDSSADIEAARAAGCRSCHAIWGIPPSSQPRVLRADFVTASPAALCSMILEQR